MVSLHTSPDNTRRSRSMRALPSSEELAQLRIPILRCSFPCRLHAEYEAVREQSEEWIVAVAQPPSAAARRFLLDCLLPLLICRNIPHATSVQRLVHVTKMIAWLTIADDDDDHPDALGSDYATTARRADIVMAILCHEADDKGEPTAWLSLLLDSSFTQRSKAQLEALAMLWEEICQEMPLRLRARFISTMADFFDGIKAQATFRKANQLPDLGVYIEIRRQASFTLPAFVLVEYALGVEVDEASYVNPLITELRNGAMDFICMCNDIISCRSEIKVGDYFNLPCVLYNSALANSELLATHAPPSTSLALLAPHKPDDSATCLSSFQAAIDCAAQMIHDLDKRCISLVSAIQSPAFHMDPSVYAYVDSLSSCMSGCLAWFLETVRYSQPSTRSEMYQLHEKALDEVI